MKKKIKKLIAAIITASIVFLLFYLIMGNPMKYYTLKSEFREYLKEKYDQEFEIGRITFDMMHRSYHSYARDDAGVEFYVGQDTNTKIIEDAYGYELEKLETENKK